MGLSGRLTGKKAEKLLLLKNSYNVPDFFTISSEETKSILGNMDISKKDIAKAYIEDPGTRRLLRDKIKKFNPKLAFPQLKKLRKKIIIRSSALGEDGKKHSFAGIYESKISENPFNLKKDLMYVLSSAFSERVWHYCKQIGFNSFPEISLIVQDYITPEYSGVTFTKTLYESKKGMMINAVKGSDAVSGRNISEIFVYNGRIPKSKIPVHILQEVVNTSSKIESFFNEPQDIEWCFSDNKLWILQSRKITKNIHEEIQVWDNSNIAESYSGIVLPLTCSFAQFIYSKVYRDLARTSNINPKKIKKYSYLFDNLLGFFYGRVYYNILNWYRMLTIFPGFDRNKRNLDMMISAKNKAELNRDYYQNVHFIDKLRYYPFIIYRVFRFEWDIKKFKKDVKKILRNIKRINFEKKEINELWSLFKDFQKNLLRRWSITVDNDFLAMTWFGMYKKYAQRYGLNDEQILHQITSSKSLISSEQVNALKKLSDRFNMNEKLVNLAQSSKWHLCYKEMSKDSNLKNEVDDYLELYGGRFANELKLEAKDLDSDPEFLPQLLYQYKENYQRLAFIEKKIGLPFYKGFVLKYLSSKAKHYLRHREELRLLRSQAFSNTRKLFIAIGKLFEKKKLIGDYNDIFYLKLEEIDDIIKNKTIKYKEIVKERKKEYATYEKTELSNVLVTRGKELPKPVNLKKIAKSKKMKGIGCSTGSVTGRITVLHKFRLPKKPLEIVVVKHTDPGWTPLFGICKGLIVENGGLLSHAAIISRELNLPCIIGVQDATKSFRDGQQVTMDGSTGKIIINKNGDN